MKKKINVCLIITIALAIVIFSFLLSFFIKNLQTYFEIRQTEDSFSYAVNRALVIFSILSFFALCVAAFSLYTLFIINRADLSELLSSTKEKRLAKKEAKRQEKLSDLEAKKEELEKTINDLKKE